MNAARFSFATFGLVCACGVAQKQRSSEPIDPPPSAELSQLERRPLFQGWSASGSPERFAQRLEAAYPASASFGFTPDDSRALALALDAQDETSVRSAALLARSQDPADWELLLVRLERREPAPSRALDAGDVVAAAALAGRGYDIGIPVRLAQLVVGETPHPDVEVRVECARSALGAGRDEVIPFLLRVLRAGTHDEAKGPPDWERKPTMTWAKTRAAEALALRAGVENRFRADASFEYQERVALDFERLLVP